MWLSELVSHVILSVCFPRPHSCQMDSGYNTQNYASNIMDTVGAESYYKENDAQTLEVETKPQVFNIKVRKKTESLMWL